MAGVCSWSIDFFREKRGGAALPSLELAGSAKEEGELLRQSVSLLSVSRDLHPGIARQPIMWPRIEPHQIGRSWTHRVTQPGYFLQLAKSSN